MATAWQPLEDFEGAAGVTKLGTQSANLIHKCELCSFTYPFASIFAYLHKGNFDFRENTDEALNRAGLEARGQQWTQRAGSGVVYACISCCEKLHGKVYLQEGGKPTSAWSNRVKKSKGGGGQHKLKRALDALNTKEERDRSRMKVAIETLPPSIQEVVDGYNNTLIAKSTDWVTKLCPLGVYLLYGCAECRMYPLESKSWFRLCWTQKVKGKTYTKEGQWRCAHCLHRWTWRQGGTQRMLVVGSHKDPAVFCSFLGSVPADLELQLGLLKTALLLTEVNGKEVTKDRLLEAIQKLNDEASGRLGQILPTETYRAQDPKSKSSVPIYCEDPRLSLECPGLSYKAFQLPPKSTPKQLTRDDLQLVIAFAAGFLDMGQVGEKELGRNTKRAFRALMDCRAEVTSKL